MVNGIQYSIPDRITLLPFLLCLTVEKEGHGFPDEEAVASDRCQLHMYLADEYSFIERQFHGRMPYLPLSAEINRRAV
jgi:hypothetical protein